ncbi:MAG: phosphonate metabolism protein/1,5-bisphosphokinase (PRPP-forming) PhnN, partial [Bacteroidota bacterium]|nr:phosphonate metabolism protein/1,5-bisphosphokinase (PRPP-forming) PhnN [Bacteroidota bacterium]
TAKPETIEKRLLQRGRESPEEINNRIQRNKEMDVDHNNIIKISNNGALENAGEQFIKIVTGDN